MPEEEILDHVAYSIIYNEPSPANGAEGPKDMYVIAAIYRSIDSGKGRTPIVVTIFTNIKTI